MAPEPGAAGLDPIAQTAWSCCGARAADARRARPVGGDHLGERFMDDEARAVCALGYRERQATSVVGAAVEHGVLALPRGLLNTLLRSLRDGHRVVVFEASARA